MLKINQSNFFQTAFFTNYIFLDSRAFLSCISPLSRSQNESSIHIKTEVEREREISIHRNKSSIHCGKL